MKRNKNGDYLIDIETYKAMMKEIINGQLEVETGKKISMETVEKAKQNLKELEELTKANTPKE